MDPTAISEGAPEGLRSPREINGCSAEQRRTIRNERSRPLIEDLEAWLRAQRARLSAKSKTANAIDYLLNRWPAFTRFLDDGRVCLSNNAAERALRGIAVGRRNWTFAGADEGPALSECTFGSRIGSRFESKRRAVSHTSSLCNATFVALYNAHDDQLCRDRAS